MNIGKTFLLTSISILSIGLLSLGKANAYEPVYGNDYANINAYGVNENDFRRDNIIRRDGDNTSIHIPKPTGKIDLNILGSKRTFSLDDEEKRKNKRKRYYKIQKRKKAKRMEAQRQAKIVQEKRAQEFAAAKAREDARKSDEAAKQQILAMQERAREKAAQANSSYGNIPHNGFIPSSPPHGF